MSKRKRVALPEQESPRPAKQIRPPHSDNQAHIQIVTGSYERVLHGITNSISHSLLNDDAKAASNGSDPDESITFVDSFLLNAHASAIKCLAISPPPSKSSPSQKIILATGSTDEKINLFHLSTQLAQGPVLPSLGSATQENVNNRSLGTLHTHNASITALHFPNRSKLLSSCGNNVMAVTSTRTFNTMSLMKAPTPKHPNRPTGDTSTASTLPSGINDFAVHPSMKLMISTGRGERNMRLWNLVTGKKAGVLSFDRDVLAAVGESNTRCGSGEGHRIEWSPDGEEYVVCFQRGMCIFGTDCQPIAAILPAPSTKLHQVRYVPEDKHRVLAVSTEDGRVLFYSSASLDPMPKVTNGDNKSRTSETLPRCALLAQLGSKSGSSGRIKDFFLTSISMEAATNILLLVTAGSDGCIRVWRVDTGKLLAQLTTVEVDADPSSKEVDRATPDVGHLLGSYETSNRITCIVAFELQGQADEGQKNGIEAELDDAGDFDEYDDGTEASSENTDVEDRASDSHGSNDD